MPILELVYGKTAVALANGANLDTVIPEARRFTTVEGVLSADTALTLTYQVTVDGSTWLTPAGTTDNPNPATVALATPTAFAYRLTTQQARIRVSNASGGAAAVTLEIGARNGPAY